MADFKTYNDMLNSLTKKRDDLFSNLSFQVMSLASIHNDIRGVRIKNFKDGIPKAAIAKVDIEIAVKDPKFEDLLKQETNYEAVIKLTEKELGHVKDDLIRTQSQMKYDLEGERFARGQG